MAGAINAIRLVRDMELAEGGWLHEGKGGDLHFEARSFRRSQELDYKFRFAGYQHRGTNHVQVNKGIPDWFYNHLYTRVVVNSLRGPAYAGGKTGGAGVGPRGFDYHLAAGGGQFGGGR